MIIIKDLWNEFINSIGFALTTLLVVIGLPVVLCSLIEFITNPYIVFWVLLLLLILYILYKLGYCESSCNQGIMDGEYKDKIVDELQLHIYMIPILGGLYPQYNKGTLKGEYTADIVMMQFLLALKKRCENNPKLKDYFFNKDMIYVAFREKFWHKHNDSFIPANLYKYTLFFFKRNLKCSTEDAERYYKKELNEIYYNIVKECLETTYYGIGKVTLKEDLSGYTVSFPLNLVPPLEWKFYKFKCTEDEKEKAIQKEWEYIFTASDRLQQFKEEADKYVKMHLSNDAERHLCKETNTSLTCRGKWRFPRTKDYDYRKGIGNDDQNIQVNLQKWN